MEQYPQNGFARGEKMSEFQTKKAQEAYSAPRPENKNYFCKYFPVEGEIKEGTKVLYGNVIVTCQSDRAGEIWMQQPSIYKPVKLFLCSRDIQVGDEVQEWLPTTKGLFNHRNFKVQEIYKDKDSRGVLRTMISSKNEATNIEHIYKVIGEISPDTLGYVKENQEFDEKDLAFNSDENEERLKVGEGKVFLMGFDWTKPEANYKGYIYIKCNCCGKFS